MSAQQQPQPPPRPPLLRVAACHASPVVLSAAETTAKCVSLIHAAADNGAHVVVFPETYIAAFPVWSAMLPPTDNHALFARMAAESVLADGPELRAVRAAARARRVVVSVGASERVRWSSATLFNANFVVGRDGAVLVHHRKLVPTFWEKLTWSPGDGHGLRVVDVDVPGSSSSSSTTTTTTTTTATTVKLGVLICGENTNPLARYSLMAQGEQLHVSTWPAIWPTRVPPEPDAAAAAAKGAGANYDNVAANRTRAAAHCFEAKAFGVLCCGYLDEKAVERLCELSSDGDRVAKIIANSPRGATMFLDPTGAALKGFTVQDGERREVEFLQEEEGILYADLDVGLCVEGKQFHDVVGGYQRLDVFQLKVNRERREPAVFIDGDGGRE